MSGDVLFVTLFPLLSDDTAGAQSSGPPPPPPAVPGASVPLMINPGSLAVLCVPFEKEHVQEMGPLYEEGGAMAGGGGRR